MSPPVIRRIRLKGIPMAPLTLKAYVEEKLDKECLSRLDIQIKTFFLEETSPVDMAEKILDEKPDLVAFSVYLWSYYETMAAARIIKDKNSQIKIICGGPQVSPIASEVMEDNPCLDVVPYITVPGEIIFQRFIETLLKGGELGIVEGIIFRDDQGLLVKTRPLTEDLDYATAPSPYLNSSFSLSPGQSYVLLLETSRGCPHDCGYCFNGRGMRKVRYFPLERVLKEIEVIYSNPDVRHVYCADSDILLNRQRAKKIIEHVIKQKTNAESQFAANVLHLDEELAKLFDQLPNHRFCFSVQTVNDQAVKCIGRSGISAEAVVKKVAEFKRWLPEAEYFIDVMLGLPGDDLAGFKMTLDVCLSLRPSRISLNYPVYLLPGSRFFEHKQSLGLRYLPQPPFSVIETAIFPKQDIETALRLIIWVDILTYFYPAIGEFFYKLYAQQEPGKRIAKIEGWISAISKDLDIFATEENMVDVATGSVQEWNKLKARLLRRASESEAAYKIYRAIHKKEGLDLDSSRDGTITLGVKIFDYMRSQGLDSVEFAHFDKLPANITQGCETGQIRRLFSGYRK